MQLLGVMQHSAGPISSLSTESGIPRGTLLEALMSFDLFACYLDTLGPEDMGSECRDTIKRVAFPSKPGTLQSWKLLAVISKIAEML